MAAPPLARILRASSLRYRGFRATGVPAILLGAAALVTAAGTARVLTAAIPSLPGVLQEATKLVEAFRAERGERRRLPG
jgi:hypothetical protein